MDTQFEPSKTIAPVPDRICDTLPSPLRLSVKKAMININGLKKIAKIDLVPIY
jgi:hypothetical protein